MSITVHGAASREGGCVTTPDSSVWIERRFPKPIVLGSNPSRATMIPAYFRKMSTNDKGRIAELEIMAALFKCGVTVSVPWGDGARYDLVVDRGRLTGGRSLYRIQCKLGRLTKTGAVKWNTCSSAGGVGSRSAYDGEQIDAYGVYYPEEDITAMITVRDHFPKTEMSLRPSELTRFPVNQWVRDPEGY